MAQRKKEPAILVVDDEELFRDSVIDAARDRQAGWRLFSAENGRQALEILERERIDLVVTDLRMPELDGLGLLAAISGLEWRPQVIAVSAFATEEIQENLRGLGALQCLDKPVALEELLASMAEAVSSPTSAVDGLSIAGFVQLLELERKSCLLRVRNDEHFADLVFVDGALRHALCGARDGEEAAIEALSWGDVHLEMLAPIRVDQPTVEAPLQHLLLEAARRTDEAARFGAAIADDLEEALGPASNGSEVVPELRESLRPNPRYKENSMSNVKESISELMELDGAIGVALVDFESGMTLGKAGGSADLDIDVAAAGNTAVVRSKMEVMDNLGLDTNIEDILITLGSQYHLIRPLHSSPGLFLYCAFDRKKSNLAMTRHKLAAIEAKLEV